MDYWFYIGYGLWVMGYIWVMGYGLWVLNPGFDESKAKAAPGPPEAAAAGCGGDHARGGLEGSGI